MDGPLVGVLAVQGDFADHQRVLQDAGLATRQLRRPADLAGIDALVLPGGESTTMLKLLDIQGLTEPLRALLTTDLPVLATCAGLILLAREVRDPAQRSFGCLDVCVSRNGYGRQLYSGTFPLESPGDGPPLPEGLQGVFIRAPRVTAVGSGVEVLARRGGDPVLLRRGAVLAACFHPEMEAGHYVTAMFVAAVRAWAGTACR